MKEIMLLKELQLRNIRSYIEDTITFPKGSILLAGDIGCGKSSLLLAIEFALFGASRTELPAELLLRKGTTSGSVTLTFELPEKTIKVVRHLKKDKDTIKQVAGEIIINNVKKELTPVEMKAEILGLLGYPEELLAKNKNYIYRYTVYTPQEEMKFILQEDTETRLMVLRRIFNIDKYNTIRENINMYLKTLRMTQAVLKAKTEPLETHRQQLMGLGEEQKQLQQLITEVEPKLEDTRKTILNQKETVKTREGEYQRALQLRQQMKGMVSLKREYDTRLQQAQGKRETTLKAISEIILPEGIQRERISAEIKQLELEQQEAVRRKTSLTERISYLQKQIMGIQKENELLIRDVESAVSKEKMYGELSQEVSQKTEIQERKKQIEDLFEKTQSLITKNQTLLSQAREMQEKVAALSTCPTCLQNVTHDHKQKITEQETHKIRQAEVILGELQKKRAEIWQQREDILKRIEDLLQKENTAVKVGMELRQISEKQELLGRRKEEVRACALENNRLSVELELVEKNSNLQVLTTKLEERQQQLQLLMKREYLQRTLEEYQRMILEVTERIKENEAQLILIEKQVVAEDTLLPILEREKTVLAGLQEQEKIFSVQAAQLKTRSELLFEQEKKVKEIITSLTKDKEQLLRMQEINHWLETFFVSLTYTIEKHVMITIHRLFNQFFKEWFSMLIDDEQVTGRIDDTFTPIIEQNGHEISFAYLSGGERTSAALAYRLALNRVINDVIHSVKTKDLLILDEPTDGFSSEQLDKVRDVLEKLGLEQTIVVSHESKIESFVENVIRVRKEGHVSSIVK